MKYDIYFFLIADKKFYIQTIMTKIKFIFEYK